MRMNKYHELIYLTSTDGISKARGVTVQSNQCNHLRRGNISLVRGLVSKSSRGDTWHMGLDGCRWNPSSRKGITEC